MSNECYDYERNGKVDLNLGGNVALSPSIDI